MLYPPRTPMNWAESVPMLLFELTSDWPTPKPISPVLDDEFDDLLLLPPAANAGAPSATTTNRAKHRILFITVSSLSIGLTATGPKPRDPGRPLQPNHENVEAVWRGRCIRETRA